MNHTPHLSEQVIIITGASAGIGTALAQTLATRFPGVRLALSARRKDKLEEIATECRTAGADVLVITTDMTNAEQVAALSRGVLEKWGRVDAVVNNAGYGQMGPIELTSLTAAKEQFNVNFFAPLILAQTLIPIMRNQGGGRIVNISSLGGRMAFPAGGLYSSSKFALEAFSDVLRMELKGFNIKVSVVEPGPVITEFFQVAGNKIQQMIPDYDRSRTFDDLAYKDRPVSSIYRPAFEKLAAIDQQLKLIGWTPEKVAKVIIKALNDPRPRPRYYAATGASIFVPLMTKVMPTWVTDAFWKRFYGIDQVEKEWKMSTNKE
ncbi:oxidoreductase [Aphanothece hegewaldii CCALA 016]|uniref:Oxidoreductase n=1 Tax=Aphanothece hegewaldii CCALA 016 TaxID=2107694 RepID=A0A2T1M157_9CHRO|nr:SDR family oxidoreductase [Aphanothece hegewaldii]PSF38412.1 oxidoreductase [Aphanothece hegewaldii CCALA 016]